MLLGGAFVDFKGVCLFDIYIFCFVVWMYWRLNFCFGCVYLGSKLFCCCDNGVIVRMCLFGLVVFLLCIGIVGVVGFVVGVVVVGWVVTSLVWSVLVCLVYVCGFVRCAGFWVG